MRHWRPYQYIIAAVHHQMMNFMEDHECDCLPEIAPIGVQLNCDDRTMVEPDLLVTCDKGKRRRRTVMGGAGSGHGGNFPK